MKDQLIGFERHIADVFETGVLPFLIHLSGGNEEPLIKIFEQVQPNDWVFSSHRNHYHYLLTAVRNGIPFSDAASKLEAMIRNGKSMFVYDAGINFCCSAVLAGTCGIAAGMALKLAEERSGRRVWSFLGDGGEDEGHFYEAALFVEGHGLPCTFVIEDNNRSVDSTILERRGKKFDCWGNFSCVQRYEYKATWPHGGTGCKQWVQFDPKTVEHFKKNFPIRAEANWS